MLLRKDAFLVFSLKISTQNGICNKRFPKMDLCARLPLHLFPLQVSTAGLDLETGPAETRESGHRWGWASAHVKRAVEQEAFLVRLLPQSWISEGGQNYAALKVQLSTT